jgi:mRNA-degrading endonuclease toxin of MazEF toxin-antitoxin module
VAACTISRLAVILYCLLMTGSRVIRTALLMGSGSGAGTQAGVGSVEKLKASAKKASAAGSAR